MWWKDLFFFFDKSSQCRVMSPFSMVEIETCSSSRRQKWIKKCVTKMLTEYLISSTFRERLFWDKKHRKNVQRSSLSRWDKRTRKFTCSAPWAKSERNEIRGKWNSIVKSSRIRESICFISSDETDNVSAELEASNGLFTRTCRVVSRSWIPISLPRRW